jgi:tetratricopeptide (TPR) repeat protein
MTTHIFLAMGMWDDVVSQNVIAAGPRHDAWHAGHYTSWLGYGYLQQGRFDEARRHLEHLRANAGSSMRRGERPSLVQMRASYLLDTERWADAVAAWTLTPLASPTMRAVDDFALAFTALKSDNRVRAEQLAADLEREETADPGTAQSDRAVILILKTEMRAALAAANGQYDVAISTILAASRMEDSMPVEFGPPVITKPTHELAGEILLAAGRAADAQREFARALELTPGRGRSLLGLARAAARAGDTITASRAARDLLRNWHAADAGLAERAELERLIGSGDR